VTRSRFVGNETRTLSLSDGDWIVVKERLNMGEARDEWARRYEFVGDATTPRLNLKMVGLSQVIAYLLDWSLGPTIRGVSVDELHTILRKLEPEDFVEIQQAIEDHAFARASEREAQKKTLGGVTPFVRTSPSPDVAGGPSSTSEPLIAMTTRSS